MYMYMKPGLEFAKQGFFFFLNIYKYFFVRFNNSIGTFVWGTKRKKTEEEKEKKKNNFVLKDFSS